MLFSFQGIIPQPLAEVLQHQPANTIPSQIWQVEQNFDSTKNYQVSAPSGKGKSTFIHILYGLRNDFTGEFLLDNQNTRKIKANQWAKIRQTRLSVVFQDLRLFLDLTAWENIQVKAVLQKQNLKDSIEEMVDYLGISHVLHKKAQFLSYGERQRVAIIRALQQPFEILLLDEPFSHLDPDNIQKASELINRKCQENQAGVIMTSLGYHYNLKIDQQLIL